jgi:3-hydroxybutyryl-CoA dehydrogenase
MEGMEFKAGLSMKLEEIRAIGIVGAGLMGHGIAQVFGTRGYRVNLYDKDDRVLESTPARIRKNLQLFLEVKLIEESDMERCLGNICLCRGMSSLCGDVDVVIEAVVENLEVKQSVFAEMERFSSQQTILCSNTSGITISRIGERLQFRERVIGTHFWNPPQALSCVEVIRGEHTSEETFRTVTALMKRVGKEPVPVKDIPGFLGNRLQLALFREALSLVQEGLADPQDIDRVVKHGFGSRLPFIGPFETMDLAGHDLGHEVQKYLFPELCSDLKPLTVLERMVKTGSLGTKAGKGFYEWTDERIREVTDRRDSGLLELLRIRDKT